MNSLFKCAAKVVAVHSLAKNSTMDINILPKNCKKEVQKVLSQIYEDQLNETIYDEDGDEMFNLNEGINEHNTKINDYRKEKLERFVETFEHAMISIRYDFEYEEISKLSQMKLTSELTL